MRRETQNLLLLLLGGALLKIVWTGGYLRYVKPGQLPWLIGAGLAVVALAVFAIARDIRTARAVPDPGDHEHASRSPWMLLLPVFAIFLVAPPALGADSVQRAGGRGAAPAPPAESRFGPLPPGPRPALSIGEFTTRVVWDNAGTLHGRTVRLQGFLVHQPGGAVQLARMRITCCAADASPIRVELAGPRTPVRLPSDTWVEATGTLIPGTARSENNFIPAFQVSEVRPISPPQDPYEY